MKATTSLLARHPEREPSTRELYETAQVTAPTLYHHFGTKEGLFGAVADEAFARYLERKRAMPESDDALADFMAGWRMHVAFGVENPVLYDLMYRPGDPRPSAAATADAELRRALERLDAAVPLRLALDEAVAVTTATAVGCVTQLNRDGGHPDGPVSRAMCAGLVGVLTGRGAESTTAAQSAKSLLAEMGSLSDLFTPAEAGLLRQWLRDIATRS